MDHKGMGMMGAGASASTSVLKCEKCGETQALPKHCGRDMIPREGKLVCWMNLPKAEGGMGIQCGEAPIPQHHGKPMKIVPK